MKKKAWGEGEIEGLPSAVDETTWEHAPQRWHLGKPTIEELTGEEGLRREREY